MARRSSGEQGDDEASVHHYSSLALLQERFNQLQKTREMRQGRELMRLISEAHQRHTATTFMHYDHHPSSSSMPSSCRCNYESEFITFPHRYPSSQLGLSLIGPHRPAASASSQETAKSSSWLFGTNLGLHNTSTSPFKFDDPTSDVDTSLHL